MKKMNIIKRSYVSLGATVLALAIGFGAPQALAQSQGAKVPVPRYKVDATWPKPLPEVKDEKGNMHMQLSGQTGGVCIDSHDHVIVMSRGWQWSSLGKLVGWELDSGVPAPPVVVYDLQGNVLSTWGDASLLKSEGGSKVMPEGFHGCWVDYEDNIWILGNADGVAQKYNHDGSKMLLQIGTKGLCDGPPDLNPKAFFPTCGSPGNNTSKTLLNQPSDIEVDPNPDPVTGKRGSIYIADGYGNHRMVVFDAQGKFLRQWGSRGSGPTQFADVGGGHPHCVALAKDGLVYTCDRGNNRILVFDKVGNLKKTIAVEPKGYSYTRAIRTNDIVFSNDPQQTYILTSDVPAGKVWVINRFTGEIVDSVGRFGHYPGEHDGVHLMATDSKGNFYTTEGGFTGSRRVQKFDLVK